MYVVWLGETTVNYQIIDLHIDNILTLAFNSSQHAETNPGGVDGVASHPP